MSLADQSPVWPGLAAARDQSGTSERLDARQGHRAALSLPSPERKGRPCGWNPR